jgi:hypothetical protein
MYASGTKAATSVVGVVAKKPWCQSNSGIHVKFIPQNVAISVGGCSGQVRRSRSRLRVIQGRRQRAKHGAARWQSLPARQPERRVGSSRHG